MSYNYTVYKFGIMLCSQQLRLISLYLQEKMERKQYQVGTIECDVCLQAVSYMKNELLKNSTEVSSDWS